MMSLSEYRKKIDAIDTKIVTLLNDRAKLSVKIGENKKKLNKGIYAPDREKQIFDQISRLNKGPMTNDAFVAIYREIMSSSLSLEKKLQIAF